MAVVDLGAVPRCPTHQEMGLCGLIAGTTVSTGYTEWFCTNGLPQDDPCGNGLGPVWTGITCSSTVITEIDWSSSSISGTLSSLIGNINSLLSIKLWSNKLAGSIPSSIALLTKLSHLDVMNNLFTGTVPATIGCLSLLDTLYMHVNPSLS